MERKKIGKESEKLFPLIKGGFANAFLVISDPTNIYFRHPDPTNIFFRHSDPAEKMGIGRI